MKLKKLLLLLLAVSGLALGFRGSGWRGNDTYNYDVWFNYSATIQDTLYVDIITGDDSTNVTINGTKIKSSGSILMGAGDTTFIRDLTLADSIRIYDDGTNFVIKADNTWQLYKGSGYLTWDGTNLYTNVDTTAVFGWNSLRLKEIHSLRHCASSPDKSDSIIISYDASDTAQFRVDADGKFKFNAPVHVAGTVTANGFIGNIRTFAVAGTSDTVTITGKSVMAVNTAGGSITIGGFIGGVAGQILHLYNSGANNITLEDDEATGNQDIKSASAADITITAEGGATLLCDGSLWWIIGIAQ